MVLVDIAAVVEIAHKHGVKVFIDNTFDTPYNTTPLDLGVDAVIHSLTKYIGGHGDLLGGAVISNDEQFLRECRLGTLMHFGSVMAPFTAFLVCRGLKTLGVRMKQYTKARSEDCQVAGGQSQDRNGPLSLPGIQSPVRHRQEADEGRRRHDLL